MDKTRPLDGIRIVDWTSRQQGPAASVMLGDLGAEVIKIEAKDGGDPTRGIKITGSIPMAELGHGRNFYFEANNYNKKSIAVDLKSPEGKAIVYRLVERSDIFMENTRQSVVKKLGMDYETLCTHNPRIVYVSATAYGSKGPDADKPGLDYSIQGRSGLMLSVGEPDMPPVYTQIGLADQIGAIMVAYAAVVGLLTRDRLGVSQKIEASLLGSLMTAMTLNISRKLLAGEEFPRISRSATRNPLWNHYKCGDGKWICFSMGGQSDLYWHDFCEAIGAQELEHDPRFQNLQKRAEHGQELISILDDILLTKPRDEWVNLLNKKDLLFDVVSTISDLVVDPQVLANEYVVDFDHPVLGRVKKLGSPIKLSRTPAYTSSAAPDLGQHTEQVLKEICGYSEDDVAALKMKGVIP
ncbi:MAG: CoA transferase [Chloroflexota bacterium]